MAGTLGTNAAKLTRFPMQFPIGGGMTPQAQQQAAAVAGRPTPAQYMMSQLENGGVLEGRAIGRLGFN